MSIYFVRHGQTDWNVAHKMQGKSDIPLNDVGRAQAEQTRAMLQEIKINKIYYSPLSRAQETAMIINAQWGYEMQADERLMERCFGELEGQSSLSIRESIWQYNYQLQGNQAEQMPAFFKRVYEFLDEIVEMAQTKHILVVAHGGVCVPFIAYFDGYEKDENLLTYIPDNCEIVKREGKKFAEVSKG